MRFTDEFGLQKLKEYYDLLGRIPIREDFRNNKWTPEFGWYATRFGSFKNACNKIGLVHTYNKKKQDRLDITIEEIKNMAKQLGRCPTAKEYDCLIKNGFKRRALENRLNLKYNDIFRKYIPEYSLNCIRNEATKEDVVQSIRHLYAILKRPPFYYELRRYGCYYSYNLLQRVFNGMSYNKMLENLGYTPSGSTTLAKSEDDMLEDFNNLFLELGRIPTENDINKMENMVTMSTYRKYFGNIEDICTLLDIDFKQYDFKLGLGRVIYDKKGEICRSSVEAEITNYFIDDNIIYVKEYPYKNLIEKDKKRFDWKVKINNIEYFVEYFGLYVRNHKGKISRFYYNKTKKKIKLLYKNGYIDNCIFIFPYDIKIKSLDEIFKPYFDTNIIS